MTIQFRLAECRDILCLGQHAYKVMQAAGLECPDPARICRMVDESVTTGNAFIAERDGVPVGSMMAKWSEDWFGARTVELGNLWMDRGSPARTVYRFGIWVMETLRERGAEQFMLTEAAGSPHKPFSRLGFKSVAVVRVGRADDVLREARKRGRVHGGKA